MQIFQRSLTKEFTSIGLSVISVLVAIIVTHQLIIFLGRAATGTVEPEAVVALIGFALLAYLPVLLALALFISVHNYSGLIHSVDVFTFHNDVKSASVEKPQK